MSSPNNEKLIQKVVYGLIGVCLIAALGSGIDRNAPGSQPSNQSTVPSQQSAVVNVPAGTIPSPLTQPPASTSNVPAADTSGYDAGYAYGEQYQICDPSYDNGNSQDFNDGVNAWTADNCSQ